MRTGGKTALAVRGACLAAGLTFFVGFACAESFVRVWVDEGAISIEARDATIRRVLEALSQQVNLIIISEAALDDSITLELVKQTVPETIHHLLRHRSYMLHEPRGDRRSTISYRRLWIFSEDPNGTDDVWTTRPVNHRIDTVEEELTEYQILAMSDSRRDREEAMFGFAELEAGIEYLRQGLTDPDRDVREAAIESLAELGGAESVQALGIALNDPDAGVRLDAVDALGEIGGPDATGLLQQAMSDENHTVREAAAEWLTELAWLRD